MSEQRGSQAPPLCACGHASYEHDPWPACDLCECEVYIAPSPGAPPRSEHRPSLESGL